MLWLISAKSFGPIEIFVKITNGKMKVLHLRVMRLWSVLWFISAIAYQTNLICDGYNVRSHNFVIQFKTALFDACPQMIRIKFLQKPKKKKIIQILVNRLGPSQIAFSLHSNRQYQYWQHSFSSFQAAVPNDMRSQSVREYGSINQIFSEQKSQSHSVEK